MAHGHKDYGPGAPISTVYTLQDMAELAARLGSADIFDRRGNVIFADSFEGSLSKYVTDPHGSGASMAISNAKAFHGDFSCKLVTGDALNDYCILYKYLPYPVLSKIGLEISWYMEQNMDQIAFDIFLYDGTYEWDAGVKWKRSNNTWYYIDGNGYYIALTPTVNYSEGSTRFNSVKIVADFVEKEYIRLIANNLSCDLSGKGLSSLPSAINPQLMAYIFTRTNTNASCIVYLDSMIVTQNEP